MGPGCFQATSRSLFGAAAVTQRARFTEVVPEPEFRERLSLSSDNARIHGRVMSLSFGNT
jgi:hypothetical protein